MRVDTAYYEDLAGRLYGLLIGLDDRIGSDQAGMLHHFIDVGEYGLAMEDIAGTLAQDAIAINGQERGDMLALAARMKLQGGLVPRALAACPQTAGLSTADCGRGRWLTAAPDGPRPRRRSPPSQLGHRGRRRGRRPRQWPAHRPRP
jgi:hypothetical protein